MKRGVLRVVIINFLCCFVLFYPLSEAELSLPVDKVTQVQEKEPLKEERIPFVEDPKNETSSDTQSSSTNSAVNSSETLSASSQSSAVEVSGEAIKGKIISQYNSPYTASLNYNKVYVKNNSGLNISIKKYLESNLNFKIKKNNDPQVLILHTHATETFKTDDKDYFTADFTSRSQDNSKNMVSVGKIVAEKLNSAGIKTIHSDTLHDYPSYSKSYSRSAQTVNSYLKKYPSIKVVLDLHRDAVTKENGDKVKLVTQINGKKAAQIMLVMGSQSGSVKNHPKWEENFKLAVRLHQTIEKDYPTLARPIMLMSKNYNQSLSTGALLLEFGTDVNTLEEVHYSAELVGNSLVKLLSSIN